MSDATDILRALVKEWPQDEPKPQAWAKAVQYLQGVDEVPEGQKNQEWYRQQASEQYEDEGTLEIDPNAIVSYGSVFDQEGDDGAYVQAWVWVDGPESENE